ncbi:hypothetical protein HCG65_02885 [Streptococcus anginosus]|uniref:hypothetical protein n=1 Tax=Streptococcus anginosus TaxID=1328 RepID=UPI001C8CEA3A|nr:hypothetical protein [Streptococcus anginosus]MBX9075493.1 hypothetical protein [Streptococcus anginosus]
MSLTEIIKLISALGIGAILSAIFTFMQSNKRNRLDYITKERSEWRRQLKQILVDLIDDSKKETAIAQLKSQINPYGRNGDFKGTKAYFMREGHIWDLLEDDTSEIDNEKLSFYVELLLKYDWERSKNEIKYQVSNFLYSLFRWSLIILSIYLVYKDTSNKDLLKTEASLLLYEVNVLCSVGMLMLLLLQNLILEKSTANYMSDDSKLFRTFIIVFAAPCLYISVKIILYLKLFRIIPLISIIFFIIILIFILEYYVINKILTFESDYIRRVEEIYYPISKISNNEIQLHNEMLKLEHKLYRNKHSYGKYLKNKIKEINKKRLKKLRPNCFIHPLKYYKWKNRLKRYKEFINKEKTHV